MTSNTLFRTVLLLFIAYAAAAVGIGWLYAGDPMPIIGAIGSIVTLIFGGLMTKLVIDNTAVQQATQARVETVVAKVDTVVTQSHEAAAMTAQVITTAQEAALQLERMGRKVDTSVALTETTHGLVNGQTHEYKAMMVEVADLRSQLASLLGHQAGEQTGVAIGREQAKGEAAIAAQQAGADAALSVP